MDEALNLFFFVFLNHLFVLDNPVLFLFFVDTLSDLFIHPVVVVEGVSERDVGILVDVRA
jgi:hypothetical protein